MSHLLHLDSSLRAEGSREQDHREPWLRHALSTLGAVGAHPRVRDTSFAPALVMLLIAVAALVLRAITT
jgi:hypothetical protein